MCASAPSISHWTLHPIYEAGRTGPEVWHQNCLASKKCSSAAKQIFSPEISPPARTRCMDGRWKWKIREDSRMRKRDVEKHRGTNNRMRICSLVGHKYVISAEVVKTWHGMMHTPWMVEKKLSSGPWFLRRACSCRRHWGSRRSAYQARIWCEKYGFIKNLLIDNF